MKTLFISVVVVLVITSSNLYALTIEEAKIVADSQNSYLYDLVKYGVSMICLLSGSRFGQEQLKL